MSGLSIIALRCQDLRAMWGLSIIALRYTDLMSERRDHAGEGGVITVFGPGGSLARSLPAYERREGQEEMALAIDETLREGGLLLIEAGTGVGKTLAYLVPAALADRRGLGLTSATKHPGPN